MTDIKSDVSLAVEHLIPSPGLSVAETVIDAMNEAVINGQYVGWPVLNRAAQLISYQSKMKPKDTNFVSVLL